jgi:DNA-binding protein HU-beta
VKKTDLVALLLERNLADSKKSANEVVDTIFDEITRSLVKGDPVAITGFGTFKKKVVPARKARMGRNPFTGEAVKIAAKKASSKPTFTPAKPLKDVVTGAVKLAPAAKPAAKKAAPAAKPAAKKVAAKPAAKKAAPAKKVAAKPAAKKVAAKPAAKKAVAKKAVAKKK